jgi:transposase-like protein
MNEEAGVTAKQRRRAQNEIEHIVAQYLGSGLNRTEFCRRHGMSLGTLNRYLKRQAARIEGSKGNGELVAVEPWPFAVCVERPCPRLALPGDRETDRLAARPGRDNVHDRIDISLVRANRTILFGRWRTVFHRDPILNNWAGGPV